MDRRRLLLLAPLALAGCSRTAGPEPLIIGMDMTYPPFEYKTPAGEPTGVDVDLAQALAAELGRELKLESLPFEGLIPSLQSGKIDLAISGMTATAERAKSIDFSDPYADTNLALLVGKNSPVQSGDDLGKPGVRLTAKLGTTGETYARAKFPTQKLIVLDDEVACVREVAQGSADAFIYDQLSIYSHGKRNADTTRALLQPVQQESWAIGMKKGRPELMAQVNAFLKKFRAAGGLEKLGDKYLAEEKKVLQSMNIPFILK